MDFKRKSESDPSGDCNLKAIYKAGPGGDSKDYVQAVPLEEQPLATSISTTDACPGLDGQMRVIKGQKYKVSDGSFH